MNNVTHRYKKRGISKTHQKYTTVGFTLLELIMATFIFSILTAGVVTFSLYYLRNNSFSFEANQAIGIAQQNVTRIVREIREARSADDGAYTIAQADNNTFIFYSDVTNDGRTDRVRYFLNGTQLNRGVIEPTSVPVTYPLSNEKITIVADYIDLAGKPLFKYYDKNWPADQINNPLSVSQRLLNTRYVSVYIRVDIQNSTGAQPFELSSGVQIRSLKDNL